MVLTKGKNLFLVDSLALKREVTSTQITIECGNLDAETAIRTMVAACFPGGDMVDEFFAISSGTWSLWWTDDRDNPAQVFFHPTDEAEALRVATEAIDEVWGVLESE